MHLHQATNSCGKTLSSGAGVVRRGHGLLGEKIAIDVGKAYPGLLRSKVRHQDRSPVIQSEEGRSATSGQPPYRPVDHPALTNKLFGDQRNGAPLKPRHPGQICS